MYNDTIIQKSEELDKLSHNVKKISKETEKQMKVEWDKRTELQLELSLLRSDSEGLNYNRNNIYQEISQRERMLKEKQDELAKMQAKEQAQQRELDEQEKLVQEKETKNEELRKQLE